MSNRTRYETISGELLLFSLPMDPSSAEQLFQRLLRELKPICKRQGFTKRSQNFVAESNECWGIINFQKSLYSDTGSKRFTINVAVAAKRILAFHDQTIDKPPAYYAGHWEERIGHLIPANQDTWWVLSDEESYASVRRPVEEAIEQYAIPKARTLMSEDALLEHWAGKRPGGFEYVRLKYRSVLLAERGKFEELGPILFRILEITRGSRAAQGAEQHVAKLKSRYAIPDQLTTALRHSGREGLQ